MRDADLWDDCFEFILRPLFGPSIGKAIMFFTEMFSGQSESTGDRMLEHRETRGAGEDERPSLEEVENVRREVRSFCFWLMHD